MEDVVCCLKGFLWSESVSREVREGGVEMNLSGMLNRVAADEGDCSDTKVVYVERRSACSEEDEEEEEEEEEQEEDEDDDE